MATTLARWPIALERTALRSSLTGVQAIAAGYTHTCAFMDSGGLRCWEVNSLGQLGNDTSTDHVLPPTNDVLTGVKAIAAGYMHSCALIDSGGLRCWGVNDLRRLSSGLSWQAVPTSVPGPCE
jgi:alpha-tubulin suppressor-like RCC1 family protein